MFDYWKAFVVPLEETIRRIISFMPRLLIATLLFLLFYLLARLIRHLLRNSLEHLTHVPSSIRILIARSIYILVLLVGFVVALSAANVNVTAVIASLGVAGFALGFALKDILENFIAGILLLFSRPFEIGDQVKLGEYEGVITDIQIRTTTLRTYNDELVAIPNSRIYTNSLVNQTRLHRRRYTVSFDTSLNVDSRLVEQTVLRLARENADVQQDPAPFVRIRGIDSGSDVLSWSLFYWAAPTKATEVKTLSELYEQIKISLFDSGMVSTPTAASAVIVRRHEGGDAPPAQEKAS